MSEIPAVDSAPAKSCRSYKWGQRFLQILGVLIVLAVSIHAVEYLRGNLAYDRARAEWKAAGLRDLTAPLSGDPVIADEQNLLKTEFFKEWGHLKTPIEDQTPGNRWERWSLRGPSKNQPAKREWYQVRRTPILNEFAPELVPIPGKSDARVILEAIEADHPEIKTVVTAESSAPEISLGRKAPLPGKFYEQPFVNFKRLRDASILLTTYAAAQLREGDGVVTLSAIRAALRYETALGEHTPALVSAIFAQVQCKELPIPLTHAMLAVHLATDAELASVDKALSGYKPLVILREAMQNEGAGGAASIEWLGSAMKNPDFLAAIYPQGWSKLNVAKCLDTTRIGMGANAEGTRLDLNRIMQGRKIAAEKTRPWNAMAKLFTPAFAKVQLAAAETQTQLNCCRLGIALERHRLKTGAFPDSLDALTPGLIASIPVGPGTGNAPVYLKNNDGGYTLTYKGEEFRSADLDAEQIIGGDIVWTMPAPVSH